MPILYEVLTGTCQFPELNPVKRGDPIRPHDRIQSDPENVERGNDVCGRASRTTRRPNRTRRAMACRVACACGLRPRVGCCYRSLPRGRPASRNAPGRERLPRRACSPDPPVGATPAAPDARPKAGRHSLLPPEKRGRLRLAVLVGETVGMEASPCLSWIMENASGESRRSPSLELLPFPAPFLVRRGVSGGRS